MTQPWIEEIAAAIKQKNQGAAEEYARGQHASGVIAEKGKQFFMGTVQCLQQNVDALRSQLQGDATAAETGLQTIRACEVRVTRARFPCVDATVEHHGETITLDYSKFPGAQGDPNQERKQCVYAFRVSSTDDVFVQDAFAAEHAEYCEPEALARRITEVLFAP